MPNYSLIIDTKFKPFSYEELIRPAIMQTQAHQAIESAYGELSDKANVWENLANEQTDPYAYKMYKNYSNDLKDRAEELLKNGLSITSRRNMLDMKTRYSKEILPIENAYNARAAEIKEQLAGRAQGMVYEGDASLASLDRYIKDPSIKYRFANSQEGFKRVASAASALAKELREYGKGKPIDAYTNTWLQQHGYSASEVNRAITDIEGALNGDGNIRGNNILSSILSNEMQTAGINDWNRAAQLDYFNRVAPALYQAVGQINVAPIANYAARAAAARRASNGSSGGNNENLIYKRMTGLNVTGAKDTKIAKEDLEFLRQVQRDPSILRRSKVISPAATNAGQFASNPFMNNTYGQSRRSYYNYDRLKAIEQKYGIDVTGLRAKSGYGDKFTYYGAYGKKLEEAIQDRISKGVITDDVWQSNTTDDSWVTKGWLNAANTTMSHYGKVDMWHYKDGKKGDRLSKKELSKISTEGSSYYSYIDNNNNVRTILSYKDDEGKSHYAEVGDILIGDMYTEQKNNVKAALQAKEYDKVPFYMDNLHNVIYGDANTRAYTQSKTKSGLVPEGTMDSDYINMMLGEE